MKANSEIRVLLVEDDFLVCEEIARSIKKAGFIKAGIASNGEKAIEMALELKPDVILMDIKMPKMNGLQAAAIIQEKIPTPIVILTAHESIDYVQSAGESGVGAYLTKPPKSEDIERAILIAMARHDDLMKSRRLIAELEETKSELAEMNASKDRFFSILAHDLKTPFSALIGLSQIMVDDFEELDQDEVKDFINSINMTSKAVYGFLENLLNWARIQTGRMDYDPEYFILGQLISPILGLLRSAIDKKEIVFSLELPENLGIFADRNMIETVIRNLLSNAIKFTPAKGNITISASEQDHGVVIRVKDTGIGMDEEKVGNLFRLDKNISSLGTDQEEGTGLGLILCKDMVEKNGGMISVESAPGEGSEFIIKFPPKNIE